jgi:hypothetical protein
MEPEQNREASQASMGRAEDEDEELLEWAPAEGAPVNVAPAGESEAARRPTIREIEEGLGEISRKSHSARSTTFAGLGVLVGIAGIAVAAGVIASNPVFWAAAGSVFVLASTGLVAWAAKQLGIVGDLAELLRAKARDVPTGDKAGQAVRADQIEI